MARPRWLRGALVATALTLAPLAASGQIAPGFVNNFQDATTQGWRINLLNMSPPPAVTIPANVPTDGPGGAGDRFLRITSVGGNGPGSKLSVLNESPSWRGNYLAAGVGSIRMNAINLGATSLFLRFLVED